MITPLLRVRPQKWILNQLKMFSPRRVSEKGACARSVRGSCQVVYEDRAKYSVEIVCQECRLPEECTISVSRLPVLQPYTFVLGQGGKLRDLLEWSEVLNTPTSPVFRNGATSEIVLLALSSSFLRGVRCQVVKTAWAIFDNISCSCEFF